MLNSQVLYTWKSRQPFQVALTSADFKKKRMLSVDEGLGGEVRCNGVIFTLS
jgi:hypothetical protein